MKPFDIRESVVTRNGIILGSQIDQRTVLFNYGKSTPRNRVACTKFFYGFRCENYDVIETRNIQKLSLSTRLSFYCAIYQCTFKSNPMVMTCSLYVFMKLLFY